MPKSTVLCYLFLNNFFDKKLEKSFCLFISESLRAFKALQGNQKLWNRLDIIENIPDLCNIRNSI